MQTLGKGAFGEVHLVRHKQSRDLFALKSMSKCEMLKRYAHTSYPSYLPPRVSFPVYPRSDTSTSFWVEQHIMAHAGSEWVVSLHHSFMDDMYLYLLMELLPGMCAHAMHDCACSSHSPHHRTPHNTQAGILGA
jgi:serine/threonine protein kinase